MQLIERQPRRVTLTETGAKILPLARRILQESEEIVSLARNEHDPLSGKLKLGLIPTIGPYLLPLVARRLRKQLPQLKLMLYEYQTQQLLEKLRDGEIEVAILALPVPMVAAIVGEGGSGGAVALASAERVLMFEHAVYSVISPEGCASILWRTAEKAPLAAEAMKMTAQDLAELGVIDRIVPEPAGGAQRDPQAAAQALGAAIGEELDALSSKTAKQLRHMREARFLAIDEPRKDRRGKG